MERSGRLAIALAMTVMGLATVQPEPARATTVVATVCTKAINPCPLADVLDSGIRSNFVPTLAANRYAVLPFSFVDASNSVTGTVVVADFAAKFIYLVGFGTAASSVGPVNVDISITQRYRTTPGNWTFGGFNIGACNGNATADGDRITSEPFVNGAPLGAGAATSPCSPFAQFFGPQGKAVGPFTTLTAAAIFGFNGGAKEPQAITLPWGDDFPKPDLTNLDIGPTTTANDFISALQSDGLALPEPTMWAMLIAGFAVMGFLLRSRQTGAMAS